MLERGIFIRWKQYLNTKATKNYGESACHKDMLPIAQKHSRQLLPESYQLAKF